jgi:hypothetical protein
MPIRLPGPEVIRRRIAETAAEMSGSAIDHYLSLLGAIEPLGSAQRGDGVPWRLNAYYGSYAECETIERAVESVQRIYPILDA